MESIKSSTEGLTGSFTDISEAKEFLEGLNFNSEDFNLDLDLKNAKSNSSINPLNNSNSNFNAWPKK